MWRIKVNNLIEEIVLPILRFQYLPNISFCFAMISFLLYEKRIFVEGAIEKYFTKIGVEKFCYALHWSCPGIVVETFKNIREEITKEIILFKSIFQGF